MDIFYNCIRILYGNVIQNLVCCEVVYFMNFTSAPGSKELYPHNIHMNGRTIIGENTQFIEQYQEYVDNLNVKVMQNLFCCEVIY